MQQTRRENITFTEQAKIILDLKKHMVRQNTYKLHRENIVNKHLIPYFGDSLVADIRKNDIEYYFISKKDYTKETLKSHLAVINEIFTNAYDNYYIERNPCEHFKLRVGTESVKKNVYTPEQAEMILQYCNLHRFGLAVDLMLRYGLSRSELLGIKWEDIDTETKTIRIRRGVTVPQKRNSGERIVISEPKNIFRKRSVAIGNETVKLIKARPRTITVSGNKIKPEFLIYNKFGKPCRPDTWYRTHYKTFMTDMHKYYMLTQKIDIPILTPHELRHSIASKWLNEGKSCAAIAAELGWSDFSMLSKVYGHRDIEKLRVQLDL